jgi:hypothetical protein
MFGLLSRSQGNTTASHNRNGAYTRNRTIPVNPNTSKQTARRTLLQTYSDSWKGLTAAQRTAWTALGASMVRLDTLGVSYTLSGLQAYESCNLNNATVGGSAISNAPGFSPPAPMATLTVTATAA